MSDLPSTTTPSETSIKPFSREELRQKLREKTQGKRLTRLGPKAALQKLKNSDSSLHESVAEALPAMKKKKSKKNKNKQESLLTEALLHPSMNADANDQTMNVVRGMGDAPLQSLERAQVKAKSIRKQEELTGVAHQPSKEFTALFDKVNEKLQENPLGEEKDVPPSPPVVSQETRQEIDNLFQLHDEEEEDVFVHVPK